MESEREELSLPYLYIDRLLNELRSELLSAMHSAVEREVRNGEVDVSRLYRAFSRAAAKQMANPVLVSEKCMGEQTQAARKGPKPRGE